MSKAVLISIRPKWCELIASGKKTIEARKTRPKIETPFKCFIYCTKDKPLLYCRPSQQIGNGKVIGEFVCDKIFKFSTRVYLGEEQEISDDEIVSKSCVPREEMRAYEGSHFGLYGWHISNLVIYDEPKKLSEFWKPCAPDPDGVLLCLQCKRLAENWCGGEIIRPPQSWCYVEELT